MFSELLLRSASLGMLSIVLILAFGACARHMAKSARLDSPENGVYAVIGEGSTPDEARGGNADSVVLVCNNTFSDANPAGPAGYVAIDTSAFVPLILAAEPDATKDTGGKTILSVALKEEYVTRMEDLTRAQLGKRIAIVVDGEVITVHKVRSVITEGKFQVTRCTDNACEILRAKLTK